MNVVLSENIECIDWAELVRIFEGAPLGRREPVKLEKAFRNSLYKCFVHSEEVLIGAGRAISDGVTYAIVFDVVVRADFQGQGVGTAIVNWLIESSRKDEIPKVLLYSVPGKEGFYKKLGFRHMKTAMGIFTNPTWHITHGYIE